MNLQKMATFIKGSSPVCMTWWESLKEFTKSHVPYLTYSLGQEKDPESTRFQKIKMFFKNMLPWSALLESFYVKLIVLVIILTITIYYSYKKFFVKEPLVKEPAVPRTRKRDKVMQYGQRVLRKVKSVSGQLKSSGQRKRKKLMSAISSRFNKLERKAPMLNIQEPPMEYLHEEFGATRSRMPQDALCLLRGIRIFGNIDAPIFSKIFKHTTAINVSAGEFLFKIGELDENFFIVQSGAVNIFLATSTGANLSLRVVEPGDSVTSLLSFLEVLTDEPKEYKTIFAKATRDSVILKIPMKAFEAAFKEYPDVYKSAIQIIMTRIQRVFFIALHQHLALSSELVNTSNKKKVSTMIRPTGLGGYDLSPPQKHKSGFSSIFLDDNVKESYKKTIENNFYKFMNSSNHDRRHSTIGQLDISEYPSEEIVKVTFPHSTEVLAEDSTIMSSSDSSKTISLSLPREDTDESLPLVRSQSEAEVIYAAKVEFMEELGVKDFSGLDERIEVMNIPGGTCLVKEECVEDNKLLYVVAGSLFVTQKSSDGSADVHLFTAFPGDMIGGLAVLTGEASVFTIQSRLPATIACLSQEHCSTLIDSDMNVTLKIAHSVLKRMSPFVRQFDFALDWVFLEGGQAVYRQYDRSDSTYIVLTGRLRSVKTLESGKRKEEAEYSKGDLVGLIEMVTSTSRNTTVMAVRDSELAKLPEGLFNAMKLRFPSVVSRLMYILGCRVLEEQNMHQKPSADSIPNFICDSPKTFHFSPHASSISTLAIVPINNAVPHEAFAYELGHSLNVIVPTTVLTSACVEKHVGKEVLASNAYKLTNFLAQQEDRYKICVYVCDQDFSPWTQQCLRQADCILMVGRGTSEATMGQLEQQMEASAVRVRKELVLLHTGDEIPHNTVEWLNKRKWVSAYHHVRCSKRMVLGGDFTGSNYNMDDLYNKVDMSEPSLLTDFSRLARWITGTSVGLVLGGGGARGGAHVGMLKVLLEARIPIDLIGGVSIGSLVSALWAMSRDVDQVTSQMAGWCRNMKGGYTLITDITYPAVSILSGRKFNSTIEALFQNKQIEDLWIPYFCVTTDITASGMRIHTHGSLWRYVRASMSLSWYSPPLCDPVDSHMLLDGGYVNNLPGCARKYIRASMSVSGVLPPVSDPITKSYLVDGCYVNNLPADVLKALGAKLVIAVDVGSQDETDFFDYGDFLSGWWVLLRKLSPFHDAVKVLSAAEIESRIAYVCCSRQLQEVKCSDYCKYIRPPIDKYSTFQFRAFEQIKDIGYQHGKTIFPDEAAGKSFLAEGLPNKKSSSHMFTSYVDLAEKMYKKKPNNLTGSSVIEEEETTLDNNGENDEDYDEIDDDNKPTKQKVTLRTLAKKVRTRRPTPPAQNASTQSIFTDKKFMNQEPRGSKNPKAKAGAQARAAYRTKAMRKRSTVSLSESSPPCISDLEMLSEEDTKSISQVQSDSELLNRSDDLNSTTNSETSRTSDIFLTKFASSDPNISSFDSAYLSERSLVNNKSNYVKNDPEIKSTGLFASLTNFLPSRTKEPKIHAQVTSATQEIEKDEVSSVPSNSGNVSSAISTLFQSNNSSVKSINSDTNVLDTHSEQKDIAQNLESPSRSLEISQSVPADSTRSKREESECSLSNIVEPSRDEKSSIDTSNDLEIEENLQNRETQALLTKVNEHSSKKGSIGSFSNEKCETLNHFLREEILGSLESSLSNMADDANPSSSNDCETKT